MNLTEARNRAGWEEYEARQVPKNLTLVIRSQSDVPVGADYLSRRQLKLQQKYANKITQRLCTSYAQNYNYDQIVNLIQECEQDFLMMPMIKTPALREAEAHVIMLVELAKNKLFKRKK